MKRRTFMTATASASLAAGPLSAAGRNSIYELRYFKLRNGSQVQRTTDFLGKYYFPAAQRAGIGPFGFFASLIGDQSPFIVALISYPSLDAVGRSQDTISADKEYQKGWDEFNSMSELSYIRMENSLLKAFDGMPSVAIPPSEGRRPARIFELRTYESKNEKASRRKIKMFNDDGEIAIFKRLGMLPVFFGETIVGSNRPNLTYMLSFDNLASREKLWAAFGSDPEWQKLRAWPELADADLVSNISNAILRPLPFSPIR